LSVLWRGESEGRTVEVRNAGRTRRLYVDGVLHTAWNPARPLTGSIWDHMALAALFAPPGRIRRVLLLGVAGGAVVHLLRRHAAPDEIVAVDRDAVLLDVAREWFDVEGPDLRVVCTDAADWVRRHATERFDMVVDDLFGEEGGEPVRAADLGDDWWRRLGRLVRPGGLLVVNFAELSDLISSPVCYDVSLRTRFPAAFRFSCEQYLNAVAALLTEPRSAASYRAALRWAPTLQGADARRLMRFRVHSLWPRG
jgi:spermidine synthase